MSALHTATRAAMALVGALSLAMLPACSGDGGGQTPAPGTDGETVSGPVVTGAELAAAIQNDGPLRFLWEVGPPQQVPESFELRLSTNHFAPKQMGEPAPEGTRLVFAPPVEGVLSIGGADTLVFEPTKGFRPGTEYTATLEQLQLGDTAHSPTGDDTWTRSFETPDFGLVRMSLRQFDVRTSTVQGVLVFSAPVSPDQAGQRARFSVDDQVLRATELGPGANDREVRFSLKHARLQDDATLTLALEAGVPLLGDGAITAPAGEASLELKEGQPLEILNLLVREGVGGHYLDLICKDHAVEGERWWWDPDTYDGWWVSNRCALSEEEVARAVHISPAVEVSVAEGAAGFRLFGDFTQGRYTISIDGGARTVDGGVLPRTWEGVATVPHRSPRLSFASPGRYLPRSAWRQLPLQHLNVEEATLSVRHVPPENLVFWLSGGNEAFDERTSNLVVESKLALENTVDSERTTWVDVGTLVPDAGQGVYEVRISGRGTESAARLVLTDLQVVAKVETAGPEEDFPPRVHAWVLDAHETTPARGAEVRLVRPSGQSMGTCRTDGDGGCTIDLPHEALDKAQPLALIAQRGTDLTYLRFSDLVVEADAQVNGEAYRSERAYRAALWTDRGVYRPGDVAHVAAVLREADHTAPDAAVPTMLHLYDPSGREIKRATVQSNAAGVLSHDLRFADFATTGRYRVQLKVAERAVGSTTFNVEEFVPERMKAGASVDGSGFLPTAEMPVMVDARWLFGGSAEGSRVEVDCRVEPHGFAPPDGVGWTFGLTEGSTARPRPLSLGERESRLDENGQARVICPSLDAGGGVPGSARLVADVAVFEGDSGRTTTVQATAPVHPERFYLGARANQDKLEQGQQVHVDGRVADWTGAASAEGAPGEVQVQVYLLQEEYGWWWDNEDSSSRYKRLLRRSLVDTFVVPVSGSGFGFDYVAATDGAGWLFALTAGDARTELQLDGGGRRYWWGDDEEVDQTPRPERPTPLVLELPDEIELGEPLRLQFDAPYAGRALVTLETDEVLAERWLDVEAGQVSWSSSIDAFVPNVYASVLLIKDPHLESEDALLPDRAFGVGSVKVVPTDHTTPVRLDLPEVIESNQTLTVKVDAGKQEGPAFVTVAAVDEGILSLTGFESPDPGDTLFARRALGVRTYETVGWTLLVPPGGPSSSTGGGAGGGGRVSMVKPVALWSGVVALDANGQASIDLDVPSYRGELRVMAVVASGDRVGHADAPVTVRDPLVLQTTLPRFLVASDIAQIPVFVSNMTGAKQDISLKLDVSELPGPGGLRGGEVVQFLGEDTGSITLEPGESGTVAFQVSATVAPAAARFKVVASAGKYQSWEALDLPIVPAQPEDQRVTRVALNPGETALTSALTGWLPGSERTSVWVTANPYGDAMAHVQHLVRYPYGCIEQTTSGTRPLLYVSGLMGHLDPEHGGDVDKMIGHGIDRVMSMQTPSGGFAYWPGSSHPNDWGTAYALHMLLDAKEAGHSVPEEGIAQALDWLENQLQNSAQSGRTAAYGWYVLARAERGQVGRIQAQLDALGNQGGTNDRAQQRVSEQRYLLMAALHHAGDRRYETELRAPDTSPIERARSNDWSYYSEMRNRALQLNVYVDLFGAEGATPLADLSAARLRERSSRWYTTQEIAWTVSGLGKLVQKASSDLPEPSLKSGGKLVKASAGQGGAQSGWSWKLAGGQQDVRVDLPGDKPAWALVNTTGVRAKSDLPMGDHGLTLRRTYRRPDGSPLDPTQHKLGDRVFVEITLGNPGKKTIQNIALVDRVPAGWELENPRLGRGALPEWAEDLDLWDREHMNVRDDRLEVFGQLRRGKSRTVVYAVRAVTAGTFTQPEVKAEAMYDPEIFSRHPGQVITVQGPWEGFLL